MKRVAAHLPSAVCVQYYATHGSAHAGTHTQKHLHCLFLYGCVGWNENRMGLVHETVIVYTHPTQPKSLFCLKLATQALVQLQVLSSLFSVSTTITTNCFLAVPTFPGCQTVSSLPSRPQSDSKWNTHKVRDRFQQRMKALQKQAKNKKKNEWKNEVTDINSMNVMAKNICSDEKCPQRAIPLSNAAEVCSAALSAAGAQNFQNKLWDEPSVRLPPLHSS